MRLKQVHIISEYKNLKNFKLDFDGISFIDVFVGKNGTGKSNLFEALLEIFRHLFEKDYLISFEYILKYEIEKNLVEISWLKEKFQLDGKEVKSVPKALLPNDILIYYSGHNTKVTELVMRYEENFKKELKEANEEETRQFIGIDKGYKSLLLCVLLLQQDGNKAKKYICKKLGIKNQGNELKIVLKRPFYAKKRGYEIDRVDPKTFFWKADGITRKFLDILSKVKQGNSKGREREEGYFEREDYLDEYILYFDINDFQNTFKHLSSQELFREFDNLKTIEMLADISINFTLENGADETTNSFSDGQFQTVYIYSIIELFKDRNCITLLDEPDSFLHPEWQYDFLNQVFEITEKATHNNHILMTSHSALTISSINGGFLNLFEINGNSVTVNKLQKSTIISSLSAGLISLTEVEAHLNINHFLNNTSGAVLFTEGITDEKILDTAWNKLYPDKKTNFKIQNAYSSAFLRNIIKDSTMYKRYPKNVFFALFDFDTAYGDWNQLGADIEIDPRKCLTKKFGTVESYSMLLPVPNSIISQQVINSRTGNTYGNRSLLTIELLFYGVPGTDKYFTVDQDRTDGFIKFISDSQKVFFAEDIVPKIDKIYFEVFRPIFDFIESKCPSNKIVSTLPKLNNPVQNQNLNIDDVKLIRKTIFKEFKRLRKMHSHKSRVSSKI